VDQERGPGIERLDAGDRRLEGAHRIRVRGAPEADVGVADLGEAEAGRRGLGLRRADRPGREHPARHGPEQPAPRPRHAPQELPSVDAALIAHDSLLTTTLPVISGCKVQKYS